MFEYRGAGNAGDRAIMERQSQHVCDYVDLREADEIHAEESGVPPVVPSAAVDHNAIGGETPEDFDRVRPHIEHGYEEASDECPQSRVASNPPFPTTVIDHLGLIRSIESQVWNAVANLIARVT
jgi:hypothetical protein